MVNEPAKYFIAKHQYQNVTLKDIDNLDLWLKQK